MKVWVIYYSIGDLNLFYDFNGKFSSDLKYALKFREYEKCKEFMDSLDSFLPLLMKQEIIENIE